MSNGSNAGKNDTVLRSINLDAALDCLKAGVTPVAQTNKNNAVAIIGMAGRFGSADSLVEFWSLVRQGVACVRDLPIARQADIHDYLVHSSSYGASRVRFLPGGYLDEVDKFDHTFFGLSQREASLIDPCQRLFLETAWTAFEDAGYHGKRLRSSRTGIFVGHSSDFGDDYRHYIRALDPTAGDIVVSGNVRSIMAGRLAYFLDLKGPTILIDTACSSSLVAVHIACRSLMRGECELAIVGSTKVDMLPIVDEDEHGRGTVEISDTITSDRATRTFDDDSTGTLNAEGTAAVVLKPLHAALRDQDNIYAVIRGSATNQNGSSIGLTAPNADGQRVVIEEALCDAGVSADTITYIEAHGTATRLGDPIEVSAISRAFEGLTERKGFCAIGSLKSNLGHLDHAAGLGGLIKAVLALQHKEIPPTLHFDRPNREIPFINSPVFVNDRLRPWVTHHDLPRRCGVSAFGLSGTNCHVVLEEAPQQNKPGDVQFDSCNILVLSAATIDSLHDLLKEYHHYLNENPSVPLRDIAATAATGRDHMAHRVAFVFSDRRTLTGLITQYTNDQHKQPESLHAGFHRVISDEVARKNRDDITKAEQEALSQEAAWLLNALPQAGEQRRLALENLAGRFVRGADIEWGQVYYQGTFSRVSLPTYSFARRRLWVEPKRPLSGVTKVPSDNKIHPLLDSNLVSTKDCSVFASRVDAQTQWVLAQHSVRGQQVMPGTAFIEMVRAALSLHQDSTFSHYLFRDLTFDQPCALDATESRDIRTVFVSHNEDTHFSVVSRADDMLDEWIVHAEGYCSRSNNPDTDPLASTVDLESLRSRLPNEMQYPHNAARKRDITLGPRWSGCPRTVRSNGEGEFLIECALPEDYKDDAQVYHIHPALMDCAMNSANYLVDGGLLLPFFYKELVVASWLPTRLFSHIRLKEQKSRDLITFDIVLIAPDGRIVAQAKDYSVKKVQTAAGLHTVLNGKSLHEVAWRPLTVPDQADLLANPPTAGIILLFSSGHEKINKLCNHLVNQGNSIIVAQHGDSFAHIGEGTYRVGYEVGDFEKLLDSLPSLPTQLIFASTFGEDDPRTLDELHANQRRGLLKLFHLLCAVIKRKLQPSFGVVVLTDFAGAVVPGEPVRPCNHAIVGYTKVACAEHPRLLIKTIDSDHATSTEVIATELLRFDSSAVVSLRQGQRYCEDLIPVTAKRRYSGHAGIRSGGTYVITGGLGGLGLVLAQHLANNGAGAIALLGRTHFPERIHWDRLLETGNSSERLAHKISILKDIEALGTRVLPMITDVSDPTQVHTALTDMKREFGSIHGVVHAAGVAGEGLLAQKTLSQMQSTLRPKIDGVWILAHKLDELGIEPEMFVLFSSATTLSADIGQADYAAANAYLDGFAAARRSRGFPALSIRWPAWAEVGMARDFGAVHNNDLFYPLPTADALALFNAALDLDIASVVVGKINTEFVARNNGNLTVRVAVDNTPRTTRKKAISPTPVQLLGRDSYSESEQRIASCWSLVLDLQRVDITSTFFDNGGNSIFATQLLRELEKEFPGLFDITDIFALNTIEKMAAHVNSHEATAQAASSSLPDSQSANMSEVLAQLAAGNLSPQEADRLLSTL